MNTPRDNEKQRDRAGPGRDGPSRPIRPWNLNWMHAAATVALLVIGLALVLELRQPTPGQPTAAAPESRLADDPPEGVRRAGKDDPPDPEAWLQEILALRSADPAGPWREELRRFREAYPDHPLPPELRAALDAEQPSP